LNRILLLLLFFFNLTCFSQTQAEMNKDAYAALNEADKKLNEVYQKILIEYKEDVTFVKSLKNVQRIWIQFRDAELEMKYPNYTDSYYGLSYPMCSAIYLKELTEERTDKLTIWLKGIEEVDMCSGSIKTN